MSYRVDGICELLRELQVEIDRAPAHSREWDRLQAEATALRGIYARLVANEAPVDDVPPFGSDVLELA
jgi:hypothetical protein